MFILELLFMVRVGAKLGVKVFSQICKKIPTEDVALFNDYD